MSNNEFNKGDVVEWRSDGSCLRFLENAVQDATGLNMTYQELKDYLKFLPKVVQAKEVKIVDVSQDIVFIGVESSEYTLAVLNPANYFISPVLRKMIRG